MERTKIIKKIVVGSVCLLALVFSIPVFAADISGEWQLDLSNQLGHVGTWKINNKIDGKNLVIDAILPDSHKILGKGTVEGDKITMNFTLPGAMGPVIADFEGVVKGNKMEGTLKVSSGPVNNGSSAQSERPTDQAIPDRWTAIDTRTHTIDVKKGKVSLIQGVPCQGPYDVYNDGKLSHCLLASEFTLSGNLLPERTIVKFSPDGTLDMCFLQQDTLIQGHLCRGENDGFETCFYPNGKLKLAWLARDEEIQGVPCCKFTWLGDVLGGASGITFYPNGVLMHGKLSRATTIEGHQFKKGEHVRFDQNGKITYVNSVEVK
jgi:hypothetical protein